MTHDETVRSESRGSLILDLETRTVTQAVGSELARAASQKFVQVESSEVHNPKKLRVTFEVHYRLENGEETLLTNDLRFPVGQSEARADYSLSEILQAIGEIR